MIRIVERFWQARSLLAAMILLQVLWLAATWLTGAASNWRKIPLILLYTVVLGVAIGCMPTGLVSKIRQFKERLVQNEKLLLLTLCILLLIPGVIYANHQRVWPYDEEEDFMLLSYLVVNGPFRRLKLQLAIMTLVSVAVLATWLAYAYRIDVFTTQRETITAYAGLVTTTGFGKSSCSNPC